MFCLPKTAWPPTCPRLLGEGPTRAARPVSRRIGTTTRIARPRAGDASSEFPPYQLPTAGQWPAVVLTGDGESGFGSGEGA